MTAADRLLDHFDRLASSEARFIKVPPDAADAMYAAVYRGFPVVGAVGGFTIGLSHHHPPGGRHQELMIAMLDDDDVWVWAMAYLAYQLREQCTFSVGDTIDFGEPISAKSTMSAFVVAHPACLAERMYTVDTGVRQVHLVELVPIYQQERELLLAGGDLDRLLAERPRAHLMRPDRPPLIASMN